jgi:hypothetical protein
MIGGALTPSAWSTRVAPILDVLGVVVVGAMIVACVRVRGRFSNGGVRVLVSLGFLNLALINLLWIYNDRYYLVPRSGAGLARARFGGADQVRAVGGCCAPSVWAAIAISGTRPPRVQRRFRDRCTTARGSRCSIMGD